MAVWLKLVQFGRLFVRERVGPFNNRRTAWMVPGTGIGRVMDRCRYTEAAESELMRGLKTALLVVIVSLVGSLGTAGAEPSGDQPTTPGSPPASAPMALLTLTTFPNAWQPRIDLRPQLQVFEDGRAVRIPDAVAPQRGPDTPATEVKGRLPADVLAAALTETKALSTVDLGVPTVTDQGTQIIDFMPAPPDEALHVVVYAPESDDGLSQQQLTARKRFAKLYRTLLDAFVKD